jgi:L-ribulose-5-phosphate 4-epimerase
MLAETLREHVWRANLALARSGLVVGTFGNVSGADFDAGLMVIKPSGVPYDALTSVDMVPVELDTGTVVDSSLRPSSDTPTHLELYRAFRCGGIVHTHSGFATAFAQARLPVRCLGTTHADYFRGDVPVTRPLSRDEVESNYERQTGLVIVETFRTAGISPRDIPAALVANHGPFVWGADAGRAVETAVVLEFVARTNLSTSQLAAAETAPDRWLIDKHFLRKHGADAYYGQP